MVVPLMQKKSFLRSGEGSLSNYNWADIASGTGFIDFYLGIITTGLLTQKPYYATTSYTAYTQGDTGGGAVWVEKGTLSFDSLVNKPLALAGKAIVTVPTWKSSNTSVGVYVKVNICKYDGSTTTVLATSDTNASGPSTEAVYKYLTAAIDVPLSTFKIGEYIRVQFVVYAASRQNTATIRVGHDPLSATDASWTSTTVNRDAFISLPVRVDL